MTLLHSRPPLRRLSSSNDRLGAGREGGLPVWAGSADFREFEAGADRRDAGVLLNNSVPASVDGALASQTADGVRNGPVPGVEQAGWIVQRAKQQILDQAKKSGLNEQDAKDVYERLDKLPNKFFLTNPGLLNTTVTPHDDRIYRQKLEELVPEPDRRQRFLDAYKKRFQDGTLRWGR